MSDPIAEGVAELSRGERIRNAIRSGARTVAQGAKVIPEELWGGGVEALRSPKASIRYLADNLPQAARTALHMTGAVALPAITAYGAYSLGKKLLEDDEYKFASVKEAAVTSVLAHYNLR